MKKFSLIIFFSSLFFIQTCHAVMIDCSKFYDNLDLYEKKLKELNSFFKPLSSEKSSYLNLLELSTRDFKNAREYTRASDLLYSDIDYGQYFITKALFNLIGEVDVIKKNNTWAKDKSLLIKALNNQLDPNSNYYGNNPYDNLSNLLSANNSSSIFISEFMRHSADWKRSRRVLSIDEIQWVEINMAFFIYTYSNIINCHANFLFRETNEISKNRMGGK